MSANKKETNRAIALGALDFLYLFASLVLINPQHYRDSQNLIAWGYGASAIVYSFGIICPFISRLFKGDIPDNKYLRIADIISLLFSIISLCGVLIYYVLTTPNWVAWLSYIAAGITCVPSFFSVVFAAREYIEI